MRRIAATRTSVHRSPSITRAALAPVMGGMGSLAARKMDSDTIPALQRSSMRASAVTHYRDIPVPHCWIGQHRPSTVQLVRLAIDPVTIRPTVQVYHFSRADDRLEVKFVKCFVGQGDFDAVFAGELKRITEGTAEVDDDRADAEADLLLEEQERVREVRVAAG